MSGSSLQNVFGTNNLPTGDILPDLVEVKPTDADQDFEDSRRNLIQMMNTTQGAIRALSQIAMQSQMPDAYDVLNKMIKTYNDQQEQLIRIYRIRALNRQDKASDAKPAGDTVEVKHDNSKHVTQSVFVGTPADLAKVLEQMKKDAGSGD